IICHYQMLIHIILDGHHILYHHIHHHHHIYHHKHYHIYLYHHIHNLLLLILPIASQSTSQIQQFNNNIITKLTEPSIKNFLEELDKNFGKGKYTIYLQKFEEEEIKLQK